MKAGDKIDVLGRLWGFPILAPAIFVRSCNGTDESWVRIYGIDRKVKSSSIRSWSSEPGRMDGRKVT